MGSTRTRDSARRGSCVLERALRREGHAMQPVLRTEEVGRWSVATAATHFDLPGFVDALLSVEQHGSSTSMARTSLFRSSPVARKDGLPEARKALKVALLQCRDGAPTAVLRTAGSRQGPRHLDDAA